MDSWIDRIDKYIWDSLKGPTTSETVAILQSEGRLLNQSAVAPRYDVRHSDQEVSGSLAVQVPAGESVDHRCESGGHESEGYGSEDYASCDRNLRHLDLVVQEKLNGILADSGPLEPILAHLLAARGKFFRPRMVISSAYACIPYIRDKKRCVRCFMSSLECKRISNPMDCSNVDETAFESGSQIAFDAGSVGTSEKTAEGTSDTPFGDPDFDDEMIDMITDVAAAFEMVHLASLVHDDIIDGSSQRRGLPTIHLAWGIHSAVLAGDFLFSEANKAALKYAGLGIASCLTDAVGLMCRGEVAQDSRFYDPGVNVSDYFYQTGRKTAALIAAACKAGAMAARAPAEVQDCLWRFGIKVGTAFQIVDDILDIVSDEEFLEKPVFSDLRRGILTLPLIYAMEAEMGSVILECLATKAVPEHKIPELRMKLVSGGHVKRAGRVAFTLLDSAVQDLSGLPDSPGRTILRHIADQLAQRARRASIDLSVHQ